MLHAKTEVKMKIKIETIDGAPVPEYAHEGDAAVDLRAACSCTIEPGEWTVVPTGIKVAIPDGYAAFVLPRSGISTKQGLTLVNSPGLIDSGYRGEVGVPLFNVGKEPRTVLHGDRIAQIMFVPFIHAEFERVAALDDTERGTGGFGSSGVK